MLIKNPKNILALSGSFPQGCVKTINKIHRRVDNFSTGLWICGKEIVKIKLITGNLWITSENKKWFNHVFIVIHNLVDNFLHNLWGTVFALDNSVDKYKSPQFCFGTCGKNWG